MLGDHLDFTIRVAVVKQLSDDCAPEIMRRYSADTCVFSPLGDNLLNHPWAERLVEDEAAVVDERLEKVGIVSTGMQSTAARIV